MDDERLTSLKEFGERLGHQFKEIKWLDQALTHKSFVYETNRSEKTANEVLEFLGDSVLGLRSATSSSKDSPSPGRDPLHDEVAIGQKEFSRIPL